VAKPSILRFRDRFHSSIEATVRTIQGDNGGALVGTAGQGRLETHTRLITMDRVWSEETSGRSRMSMQSELPSQEDLKKLPLGAIVAYAARYARRVQPRFGSAAGGGDLSKHTAAVDAAIAVAEKYCQTQQVSVPAYDAAHAAQDAAADEASRDAARAASAAARAASYAFDIPKSAVYDHPIYASRVAAEAAAGALAAARAAADPAAARAAARADFARLLELNSGAYPAVGTPLDPAEHGPLGPLWQA